MTVWPEELVIPGHAEGFDTVDMTINVGPQHPATHGVFRMALTVDGEVVMDCEPYSKENFVKASANSNTTPAVERDLFAELSEGVAALEDARQSKRTLRTHATETRPVLAVTAEELIRVREDLNLSRALFANYLRTNVRTLENWEQGRAKPNAQAALLISLVKHFPDTVERLAAI